MICPSCNGLRTICKQGGAYEYCPKCNGRGRISENPGIITATPSHEEAPVAVKKETKRSLPRAIPQKPLSVKHMNPEVLDKT